MADRRQDPPAGIYLHIPFCRSKCSYCAFVSYAGRGDIIKAYLAALHQEMDFYADHPLVKDIPFASLFVGGGTPTVLPAEDLADLICRAKNSFHLDAASEITVECNPNTLTPDTLQSLQDAGVNRLSIGAQSFHDSILKRIGRLHSSAEIRSAVRMARETGFTNLNLDLIYGLPGQELQELESDIQDALELKPEHLSVYQLSIDDNTPFADLHNKGQLDLPSDDTVATMAEYIEKALTAHGYKRYEISNYALPGRQCRHNRLYWQNDTYLGFGCAAVSFLQGTRIKNTSDPDQYIMRLRSGEPAWVDAEALAKEASFRETVIMGLRLLDGIDINGLQSRYGIDIRYYYKEILDSLLSRELVKITDGRLHLSARALPVANQILAELV